MNPIIEIRLREISNIAYNMQQSSRQKQFDVTEQFKRIQEMAEEALKAGGK